MRFAGRRAAAAPEGLVLFCVSHDMAEAPRASGLGAMRHALAEMGDSGDGAAGGQRVCQGLAVVASMVAGSETAKRREKEQSSDNWSRETKDEPMQSR